MYFSFKPYKQEPIQVTFQAIVKDGKIYIPLPKGNWEIEEDGKVIMIKEKYATHFEE